MPRIDIETTKTFYPDLVEQGGLGLVMQSTFDRLGCSTRVSDLETSSGFPAYLRVEAGSRQSQVFIAAEERLFLFDFWSRGVLLATGKTTDLEAVARAIDRWLGSSSGTPELACDFDFVEVHEDAWAYEQGVEVEQRWRKYLDTVHEQFPELKAVVAAAAARPELRQLFPYTSLNRLCFSRCTGYPYTHDIPLICPTGQGDHVVVSRNGKELGRGDARHAVELVIKNLPPGCGPAVAGTARDL